jgi:hypothetical protein
MFTSRIAKFALCCSVPLCAHYRSIFPIYLPRPRITYGHFESRMSVAAPPPDTPEANLPTAPIVIQGVTTAGRAFRPSDWAERLCGVMSTFGGDQQMRYSPYVRPVMLDGVRCVIVEPLLREIEPRAYRFLFEFAKDNELVVIDPTQTPAEDFCPVPGSVLEQLVAASTL